jgi:hypothetical protein
MRALSIKTNFPAVHNALPFAFHKKTQQQRKKATFVINVDALLRFVG